jgi:hypothetical protein
MVTVLVLVTGSLLLGHNNNSLISLIFFTCEILLQIEIDDYADVDMTHAMYDRDKR